MDDLPELMTVAEIATILKVHQQTVRNWLEAGRLPHLRLGERRVRVYRADFDAFVAGGSPAQPPVPAAAGIWDGVVCAPVER